MAAGVAVSVRAAPEPPKIRFALGMSVGSEDVAATVSEPAAVSTSLIVKTSAPVALSSAMLVSAMSVIVGTSFTASTVTTKVSLVVAVPSLTVTVIVAVPNWLAAGVAVSVRAAPEPPKTRFALGISVGSEDVAATVSEPAAVSTSPIVTASAPVALSSEVVVSAMSEIVGASFAALSVMVKVCAAFVSTPPLAVPPLSWTVTVTVALPLAFAAGVKVSAPLAARAGWALKRALALFVRVKLNVWADSSAGPAEMLVAKPLWLCAPASSATVRT